MHTLNQLITPSGPWTEASAFVFDVFGTIADVTAPNRAYKELMQELKSVGYDVKDKKWDFLTIDRSFAEVLKKEDPESWLSKEVKNKLEESLVEEVNSIRLYDDVIPVFKFLMDREIGVALCSNLATPYASKVVSLLSEAVPDVMIWSFELGIAKPHPGMFYEACKRMGVEERRTVMVGNSDRNDVIAARAVGLQAFKIKRNALPQILNEPLTVKMYGAGKR